MKCIRNRKLLVVIACAITLAAGIGVYYRVTTFTSVGYDDFPEKCPIHNVKTKNETLDNHGVVYRSFSADLVEAKAQKFPFDAIYDGEGHPNQRYKRIRKKYCPHCRKAREEWLAENR